MDSHTDFYKPGAIRPAGSAEVDPAKLARVTSIWAMATAPQPDALWPIRCLIIWEAANPYLSCRTMHDGRVVAGGEDAAFKDETKRDALTAVRVARIGREFKKLLPALDVTPAFAWAGCFWESEKGLPAIGEVPGAPL